MKSTLKIMTFNLIMIFIFTPLILKACDREHEYETAKYKQWEKERKAGVPYTSFSE